MNTKVFLVENPDDFKLPIERTSAHLFMIIHFKNRKHALLTLYKDIKPGRPNAKYGLPGGKNEPEILNEQPLDILKRELKEELDYVIDFEDICPGATVYRSDKKRLTHSFYSLISRDQAQTILENSQKAEHKHEFSHFRVLRIDPPYLENVLMRKFSEAHKLHLQEIMRQLEMI